MSAPIPMRDLLERAQQRRNTVASFGINTEPYDEQLRHLERLAELEEGRP